MRHKEAPSHRLMAEAATAFPIVMNDSADSHSTHADEQLLSIVRQLASEIRPGRPVEVTPETSFERDLGLDSLARVELIQRIEQHFGTELPDEVLSEADTPRQVLGYLGKTAPAETLQALSPLSAARDTALPAMAETLLDVLDWHVAQHGDSIHILLHDEQHREHPLRYRDLLDAACAIAGGLSARGLRPRQTVALMLPTGRDYLASFFGIMMAGGIPVPIYPPARMSQIEDHLKRHARILSNAEAVLIITVEPAKPVAMMLQAAVSSLADILTPQALRARSAPVPRYRPRSSDIAFLQYTSGSTGTPKGVMLTHANLLANIRALGQATRAGAGDIFVSWLPLYHDMGLIGAWFGSMYHGMPLVLLSPLAFLSRPALWLQTISRHRGTMSAAPNFAYELCVRHISDAALAGLDLSSWRLALNGAEPVSPATLEAFARRFADHGFRRAAITPVYGLAESSVGLAFPPLERGPHIDVIQAEPFSRERKALPAAGDAAGSLSIPSCGRALPGHAIRIVDDGDVELPERCIGHLQFQGPSTTAGYYRNPHATRALLRNGWCDSGDLAYMAAGEVHVTGRVKDLIKRGGRSLYPYDLEEAAGNLPGIRKGCVAVFASPDPATGSERLVIMAETREREDAARARLHKALNQIAIDVIGMPADDIVLVPPHTVLKTSSGKIRRLASREMYEQGTLDNPAGGLRRSAACLAAQIALARAKLAARYVSAWVYGGYAWLVFGMIALSCGVLAILLQKPSTARRIARFGARLLFRLTGVALSAEGIENLPHRPHVLLVNHASYLDAIVLTALLPAVPGYAFVAKREFAEQPAMRAVLNSLGTLFIKRFDARRSTEEVDAMAAALLRGENILVFPEGTFDREAGLRPFHSGALAAAAKAAVPVAVAGLRGTRSALRAGTWRPRPGPIELEVGQTLSPAATDWRATVQLTSAARAMMSALCGEFPLPE